jgi:hypothetical protein
MCDECKQNKPTFRIVKDTKGDPVELCQECNRKFTKDAWWVLHYLMTGEIV